MARGRHIVSVEDYDMDEADANQFGCAAVEMPLAGREGADGGGGGRGSNHLPGEQGSHLIILGNVKNNARIFGKYRRASG